MREELPVDQPPQDRLRVVVIGLGFMGMRHITALRERADLFEIVGGYDQQEVRRDQRCEAAQIPRLGSALEGFKLAEVAYIVTPTTSHAELALLALEQGCHVFIEKPLTEQSATSRWVIERASALNLQVTVGHVERFNPVISWVRAWLADQTLRAIHFERIGPQPERIQDVGVLSDLAVHDVDLISYLSRSPLAEIHCVTQRSHALQDAREAIAQVIAKTRSGVVSSLNTHWLSPLRSRIIKVVTDQAYLVGDLITGEVSVYRGGAEVTPQRLRLFEPGGGNPLRDQSIALYQLLCALGRGDCTGSSSRLQNPPSQMTSSAIMRGEEALEVVEWVERCQREASTGPSRGEV